MPSEHHQYKRKVSNSRLVRLAPAIRTSLVQKKGQCQLASTPSTFHQNITSTKTVWYQEYVQYLPSKHRQHKVWYQQYVQHLPSKHRQYKVWYQQYVQHLPSKHRQHKGGLELVVRLAPAIKTSLVQSLVLVVRLEHAIKTSLKQRQPGTSSTSSTCHLNIASTKTAWNQQYIQYLPSKHRQYKDSLELVVRLAPAIKKHQYKDDLELVVRLASAIKTSLVQRQPGASSTSSICHQNIASTKTA